MLCLYGGLISAIQIFSKAKLQTGSGLAVCLASLVKADISVLGSFWLCNHAMCLG